MMTKMMNELVDYDTDTLTVSYKERYRSIGMKKAGRKRLLNPEQTIDTTSPAPFTIHHLYLPY